MSSIAALPAIADAVGSGEVWMDGGIRSGQGLSLKAVSLGARGTMIGRILYNLARQAGVTPACWSCCTRKWIPRWRCAAAAISRWASQHFAAGHVSDVMR